MADYIKLSDLVDKSFTVTKVNGYNWKKWDNDEKKMLSSSEWQEGYSKKWQVTTDRGELDLSSSQVGQMLEKTLNTNGAAELVGRSFTVKSNGKTGMEIRYFFNINYKETTEAPKEESKVDEIDKFFGDM